MKITLAKNLQSKNKFLIIDDMIEPFDDLNIDFICEFLKNDKISRKTILIASNNDKILSLANKQFTFKNGKKI